MLAIQPIRHSTIKKYFDKFKYQRKKRELLLELLKESEEQAEQILGPTGEFVPYLDALPEIKTFLAEIEAKEKLLGYKPPTTEAKELESSEEGSAKGTK
jgi:hypothetical protein